MALDATDGLSPELAAENKGPIISGVICSITALATVFVAARFFVKGWLLKKISADDYIILVSLIFGWLAVAFSLAAVRSGDGRHMLTLTTDQMSGAILWTMVGFFPSILSITIPKFAVVSLLIRLLNPGRWHRILLWTMVTLSGLSLCGCMIILWAQCTPTRAQWDFSITDKKCWDIWILIHYSQVVSATAGMVDLYLAVYPSTILITLQLHWKKKFALSIALGVGVVAAVTAFYKASTLKGLASQDFTWDTCDLTMWTCIEGGTIIIAACIPLLQPLLDLLLGRRSLSSGRDSGRKYYNHDDFSKEDQRSGTELSGIRQYRRMGKSDLVDTSILVTKNDKADSQESIIERGQRSQQQQQQQQPGHHGSKKLSIGGADAVSGGPGIVVSQEITVEYGANHPSARVDRNGGRYAEQWKAV